MKTKIAQLLKLGYLSILRGWGEDTPTAEVELSTNNLTQLGMPARSVPAFP